MTTKEKVQDLLNILKENKRAYCSNSDTTDDMDVQEFYEGCIYAIDEALELVEDIFYKKSYEDNEEK